jgi:hypothetical protein
MADYTERFTEVNYPLLNEFPDSIAVGTHLSNYVNMEEYHRGFLFFMLGDMTAGGDVDIALYQAQDNIGTGRKAITGKAATELNQAAGHGDDLVGIELQTEELDVSNDFNWVQVEVYVGGAASELGWTFFGRVPRFAPTATTNWHEIVG